MKTILYLLGLALLLTTVGCEVEEPYGESYGPGGYEHGRYYGYPDRDYHYYHDRDDWDDRD